MFKRDIEDIIESPERGTAGLTSATQIVDITDSVSFAISNTSSAVPEYLLPSFEEEKPEEPKVAFFEPSVSKRERFKKALRESMRRNKGILDELSKY